MGIVLLALIAAVPWLLADYVRGLPYAPECPRCSSVTGQRTARGLVDRACALLSATPVRTCERCGWTGRMRWRVAAERARGRSHRAGR